MQKKKTFKNSGCERRKRIAFGGHQYNKYLATYFAKELLRHFLFKKAITQLLHTVFADLQKKSFWMKDVIIILFPCHFTITFRVQISVLKSNLFNTLSVCSIKIYNDAIWTSDWIHLVDLCMLSSFQFSPFSELMFQFGETGKRIWNWNIANALECWYEWHCFKFATTKKNA